MTAKQFRVIISKTHGGIYNYPRIEKLLPFPGVVRINLPGDLLKRKNGDLSLIHI